MNELDRILTATNALASAIAGALVSKGVISKQDLLNDITVQTYQFPIPNQVLDDLQRLIASLPDHE